MENNADTRDPHPALRQLRREFSAPGAWAAVFGVAAILTFAGAFGTGDLMPFAPRLVYWMVLVTLSYATGALVGGLLGPRLKRRFGEVATTILVGIATGIAVTLVILGVNLVSFPDWTPTAQEILLGLAAVVVPIAIIVTFLLRMFELNLRANSGDAFTGEPAPTAQPPRILTRLPLAKRGDLLALSVEDHYVRVRTDKGEELILMRLTDAIAETEPIRGMRVHRSHWVANAAVAAARREGDRGILTLTDGTEVPVSRANIPEVRSAGLLP